MKKNKPMVNHSSLILITGGNRGLGKNLAEKFIENGSTVIVTSRSFPFLNKKINDDEKLIKQYLDVTNEESIKQLFAWVNSLSIQLNVLINNAGIGIFKTLNELTLAEWNLMIQTNLTGAFLCAQQAYRIMKTHGGGRIINIGSIADKIPLPYNIAYGSSKCGLKGLSAILNEEVKFDKIRVTHVTLGAVRTDIWNDRQNFSKEDMLDVNIAAQTIAHIAYLPLDIRLDYIEITPEKGTL